MAKLVEQKIIHENILRHLQNSYTYQSKRLQGTPIFVTYYNRNVNASEQDQPLETVKDLLGYESPVNYNKINDFPLYLAGEVNPNIEIDESFGLNTESTGEAVILPNMIKPYVDDFFHVNYMDEEFLFRVTKYEVDKLNGQKFYKIEYEVSHYTVDQAEEKLDTEYSVQYENIGTKENPIIEQTKFLLIQDIDNYLVKLKKFFVNSFLNRKYNVFTYRYNDKNIYNEFLIRFLINNGILDNTQRTFLGSYYIQDIFVDSPAFYELYDMTIYKALEENDIDYFKLEDMVTMEIIKNLKNNPFSLDYNEYYRVCYVPSDSHNETIKELDKTYESYKENKTISLSYDDVFGRLGNTNYGFIDKPDPQGLVRHAFITPHQSQFISNCNSGIMYENNREYFLENILVKYFNKTLVIDNEFLDTLNKHNFFPTFREYLLIPCLIFILKNEIKLLTNS